MAAHLTEAAGGVSAEPKCPSPKQRGVSQNGHQLLKRFSTCYTSTSVASWLIRLALPMRCHLQIKSLSASVVKFYFSPRGSEVWREVCIVVFESRNTSSHPLLISWLQMAQVCPDRSTKDRTGRRVENSGLDAWQTSNTRLPGYWLRRQVGHADAT
jgi:hypothetical protein